MRKKLVYLSLLMVGVLTQSGIFAQNKKDYKDVKPTDVAGDYKGSPKPYNPEPTHNGVEMKSMYLTMRDGVQLAVDVYLPRNRKKGEKLPTLLHQTRYWRLPQLRFPFSVFSRGLLGPTGKLIKRFIEQGYVIVNVDVRGSGASFGVQPYPWWDMEVKDGAEVLDWIVKQEWSNQNVGSLGASYSGTAAEFLATNKHPALKAIVPMYALFDVFEDNAFPGGVHHVWFTNSWGKANDAMDANELPENYQKMKKVIKGVKPVAIKQKKGVLKMAVLSHQHNGNVNDYALNIDYRDDVTGTTKRVNGNDFSPHNYVKQLDASGVAVYSYSGWHDGAYQHSAIKRQLNLSGDKHKLILGAWEHGGAFLISPFTRTRAGFDHAGELLKFMDYHLKGLDNKLYEEERVHYFTMGLERWQANKTFPPDYVKEKVLYMNGNKLSPNAGTVAEKLELKSDTSFGTGDLTRWKALNGKVRSPYTYADWSERTKKLLHTESEVLANDMEVTGHPLIEVYVRCSKPDGSLFVYLEDVDKDGTVRHVTEGEIKFSHSKLSEGKPTYVDNVPHRSHERADESMMQSGEVRKIVLDLLPISYLFKKGNKIRLGFSSTDKDHFELINPEGYTVELLNSPEQPAKLVLPARE